MSNFYDRYIKRTIGDCKSVKEHNLKELKDDFEEVLNDALTSDEYLYTKVNELPDLNSNSRELMIISNVTNNDKTALDEKYLLCRNDVNIDVGCYVHDGDDWYLLIFNESKATKTYKKFTMRRCNVMLKLKVEGEKYSIPVSIANLTMYAKGISDMKYMSEYDAKRNVFIGSNPITDKVEVGTRIMLTRNNAFRINHINDFEFTRKDLSPGLLKWLCSQCVLLQEDDLDNEIAYDPIGDKVNDADIDGDTGILPGEENEYSVNYDGEVIFELDRRYSYSQLIDHGDNSCTLIQDVEFDVIGDSVCIIAKDKNTNATIDMIVVNVRGN